MIFVTIDVISSTREEGEFSYIMVVDAIFVGLFNAALFYWVRTLILRGFMQQLVVEESRNTINNIFENFPDAVEEEVKVIEDEYEPREDSRCGSVIPWNIYC